jgi:signal transduction histidine kinase
MTGVLDPGERQQIQSIVEDRLRQSDSTITDTPARLEQLRAQIGAVLDDVDADLRGRAAEAGGRSADDGSAVHREAGRIPPIGWLHAAEILFEAALQVLLPNRPDQAMRITVRLHRAITERVSHGATSYVSTMLHQVRSAEQAQRQRLARELHDRAASGAGVALENLEMFQQPGRGSGQRLVEARMAMHDAIDTIRTIATELRDTLGDRTLPEAITSYLARFAPPGVRTTLEVTGVPDRLPAAVAQELYVVMREAVHNTLLHASARTITVRLAFTPPAVSAEVRDDGVGFDLTTVTGTGLTSMRERLELMGGTLTLRSERGRGSTLRAVVPLLPERADRDGGSD